MLEQLKEILKKELEPALIKYNNLIEEQKKIEEEINEYNKQYSLIVAKSQEYYNRVLIDPSKTTSTLNKIFHKKQFESEQQAYLKQKQERDEIKRQLDELLKKIDKEIPEKEAKIKEIKKKIEEEKLLELKEKYEFIEKAKNLKELGLTIRDVVRIFKEHNIPLVLTEKDKIIENESEFNKKEEFILVHKTAYAPTDDEIKNITHSNVIKRIPINTGKTTIDVDFNLKRDTVHFVLNGEVPAAIELSLFKGRKYAIVIPLEKVPNIVNFALADSYSDGNVKTEDGIILCPEDEIQKLQEDNPNTIIIGYRGNANVDGFANILISIIGYKYEISNPHSWINSKDVEKVYHNKNLGYLGSYRLVGAHAGSEYAKKERIETAISYNIALIKKLVEEDIEFDVEFLSDTLSGLNCALNYKLEIQPDMYDFGIYENTKEKFYQEFKESLEKLGIEIPYYIDQLIKAKKEKNFEMAYMSIKDEDLIKYLEKKGKDLTEDQIIVSSIAYSILKQIKLMKEKKKNV